MRLKRMVAVSVLAALTMVVCAVIAWRLSSPSPTPRRHLMLDETGCLAATRFGLSVSPLAFSKSCTLVVEADFDFNWVSVGALSINRRYVVAVFDEK